MLDDIGIYALFNNTARKVYSQISIGKNVRKIVNAEGDEQNTAGTKLLHQE